MDFYDVRVVFRILEDGSRDVRLTMRTRKKKNPWKEVLPFPDDISERELVWESYGGERLAVYHRKGTREYINRENSRIHIDLAQKLESIVWSSKKFQTLKSLFEKYNE